MKPVLCGHPDRRHMAKNKCHDCYWKDRYQIRKAAPTPDGPPANPCPNHPDRPIRGRGLCLEEWRKTFKATGTRRALYNVTPAMFKTMFNAQSGCCPGCLEPFDRDSRRPVIDHSHACCPTGSSCGKCVTGLLCSPCNRGLGLLGDDPDRLDRLSEFRRKAVAS